MERTNPESSAVEAASRRAFWLALASGATHHLTTGTIHFLPALYALKLGAPPFLVGLIPAAHSFPGIIAALPGGKLVDRFGARRVTRWTTLARIFAILIYPFVHAPLWLVLPNFISGALATVTVVSLHTYVSGISLGGSRRRDISQFAITGTVGELIGPTLAGMIVDRFEFTTAFLVSAALCTLSFAAASSLPPAPEIEAKEKAGADERQLGFRGLITKRSLQAALCGTMLFALLQGFLRGFLPVLLYGSYSATRIGSLFFAASLASLCGRSLVGWQAERWSPLKLLPATALFAALPFVMLPFSTEYLSLVLLMLLYGLGQGLLAVLGAVLIAEYSEARERGVANGIRLATMRVGGSAGPLLFGPLAQVYSTATAFVAVGAVSILVAVFLFVRVVLGNPATTAQRRDLQ